MNSRYEAQTFTLPLSFEAHALADKYCRQQAKPERAKQVYVTELAVYAVNEMLTQVGIDTDWLASYSRDSLFMQIASVGDLVVQGIGKLECCPILPNEGMIRILPEAWSDRIGYVAVQLDQSLREAKILGFARSPSETIPLSQLSPLNELFPYLLSFYRSRVNLTDWLQGKIERSWQLIEELLPSTQLTKQYELAFRKRVEVSRGKIIDLGMRLGREPVALLLTISPESGSDINVWVRICPVSQTHLTPGVKMTFIDESDNQFEVESREADIYIQDEYVVKTGERFSIKVAIDNVEVATEFVA